MKIITPLLAGLLWIFPAYAQEEEAPEPVGNPVAEFGYLVQCTATQATLMHLRMQVAASIEALSADPPQPQLAAMIASYTMLAQDDEKLVKTLIEVIRSAVVPQLTNGGKITPDAAMDKANELINQSLVRISSVLSNPTNSLADQVNMEKLLIEQSRGCASLADKVMQRHTI